MSGTATHDEKPTAELYRIHRCSVAVEELQDELKDLIAHYSGKLNDWELLGALELAKLNLYVSLPDAKN